MDPSVSLLNYFNQLTGSDLSVIANSVEYLQLLNTNLDFVFKFFLKSNEAQSDALTAFLEEILLKILAKNDDHIELSRVEVNFVFILCKLFSSQNHLNEKINSLVLANHRIDLNLKVDIVQCLFEEQLTSELNCLLYVDFVFSALDKVCGQQCSSGKQLRTKLINNLIWIIFDFLRNDALCGRVIEKIGIFFDNSAVSSADEQLVESMFDFVVSLIRFGENEIDFLGDKARKPNLQSKPGDPKPIKPEHVESIKAIINTELTRQLVVRSLLHKLNSSIRKKARYVADRFRLISLDALEFLEVLEENQFHLIEPVLERTLNSAHHHQLVEANPNIRPYRTVLEIVIQRMFNHDCRLVKTAAFRFIQSKHSDKQNILEFLSEEFILDQLLSALQDNQLYDSAFDYRSLSFLSVLPPEKILISLLAKEHALSVFGLYFILKQLFSNLPTLKESSEPVRSRLDVHSIQKFFSWLRVACGEQSIAVQITVHLVCILARELQNNVEDFEYLLNILSCVHIKEVKLQNIGIDKQLPKFYEQIELDQLNLNNSGVLTGFARYWAIIYGQDSEHRFRELLDSLQAKPVHFKPFLTAFLSVLTSLGDSLTNYLIDKTAPDVSSDSATFELICSRKLEDAGVKRIEELLIVKIGNESNVQTKFHYLSFLNDLERLDSQTLLIDQVLSSPDFRLQIQSKRHWQVLNKYLSIKSPLNLDRIASLFSSTDSSNRELTTEILLSLPCRTSIGLNHYVIEFLGLLLKHELSHELQTDQSTMLKEFFTFTDLLFRSCQEDKKLDQYRRVFKVFIKAFAFNESLFHSKVAKRFFGDPTNRKQLDALYEKICELNSLEVKSLLSGHLCNLLRGDLSLLKGELGDLLIKNLQVACLLSTSEQSLINELKQQVFENLFVSGCLNIPLKLDFYKKTRAKGLSICLSLDLDTLAILMRQMISAESQITEKSRTKNFVNSVDHRTLTKIWQFILMVNLRLLNERRGDREEKVHEMLSQIYQFTMTSIVRQSSTTLSVKLMQQLIVIALVKDRRLADDRRPERFYEQFKELLTLDSTSSFLSSLTRNKENEIVKVGYIVTLLTIMYHLIRSRPELKIFPVNYLLTCNHHRTRLFSHLVLSKEDVRIELSAGESGLVELQAEPKSISGSHNLISNLRQLQRDWFFSLLDCDRDLNLNFIFQLLPKLTNLYADDQIGLSLLSKYFDFDLIELCNKRSKLVEAVATNFLKPARDEDLEESADKTKKVFQKKGYSGPQLDLERSERRFSGQLIICASLLDRAPNLGGLARTSEIFGIKRLLIANNHILNDREFLSLSVTAHRWLDIEEVFPWNLIAYLRDLKRNHDYTLVGIEQSTESVCLTSFKFPKRSIVVLGNEKEGLPVELLQMMDYCVEIPQIGIIKSLNVHVTGALIAFEYFKQHSLSLLNGG